MLGKTEGVIRNGQPKDKHWQHWPHKTQQKNKHWQHWPHKTQDKKTSTGNIGHTRHRTKKQALATLATQDTRQKNKHWQHWPHKTQDKLEAQPTEPVSLT